MNASEILHAGDLQVSLKSLIEQVRKNPADLKLRIFLFQLYCVLGQWEKALNQLQTLDQLDVTLWPMTQSYREIIRCELLRGEVFAGKKSPLVFGEPMEWIALLLEAIALGAKGNHAESAQLRQQALDTAVAISGTVDGERFAWMADADSRLGPILEVIINGRYYWVPFQRIHSIEIIPPQDLRDLAWVPAQFVWVNEGSSTGFIPTRYPGTENSDNDQLRLARRTEWLEIDADTFHGLGQRLLTTDQNDYPIMDVREIQFEPSEG